MQTVAAYCNRYPGSRIVIVGKGPTRFNYENLADITDPIIFINDAVQFERTACAAEDKFWFFHDVRQVDPYLHAGLRATPVVPLDGATDSAGKPMATMADLAESWHAGCITYRWGGWDMFKTEKPWKIDTREAVAKDGRLYLHSGTIHTAIHFAWLCGAKEIVFIGCDGYEKWNTSSADTAYDPRISIDSGCQPMSAFGKIRKAQDQMCEWLGLKTEYINEPRIEHVIPKIAHFIWFTVTPGADLPAWARANIEAFRVMHPEWDVRVWRDLPGNMPADLRKAAADCHQLCMKSDILSYWLLHKYGGIYLDADYILLHPFDPLRRYAAFAWDQHDHRVNCSVMGSVPGGSGMGKVLDEVRKAAAEPPPFGKTHHRTHYGPRLLTNVFGRGGGNADDEFAVLPQHYFGLLIDGKEAKQFQGANEADRQAIFDGNRHRITDQTPPYAIHLWGVDGSSVRAPFGRGDALVERLRDRFGGGGHFLGAEVGVLSGRLSEHVLRACPNMALLMVDRWDASDPDGQYVASGDTAASRTRDQMLASKDHAMKRTAFAGDRAIVMHGESVDMAAMIEDESLDFVFIDADHTYEGCRDDVAAWARKVRAGGLMCGHDMDNPACGPSWATKNPLWGVRRAVEEWMRSIGLDPETDLELGGEYTWYVRKPGSSPTEQAMRELQGAMNVHQ